MKKLIKTLNEQYDIGNPIIPDALYNKIEALIGYEHVGSGHNAEVEHTYPLYSLQKFYGEDPMLFAASVDTPKLDGAAVALYYLGGKLISGLTRGNGIKGQDITNKLATLVPNEIAHKGFTQVVGEVVAPSSIENSRNYAAGALNLKSVEEFRTRDLTFIAYNATFDGMEFPQYTLSLEFIHNLGFNTVIHTDTSKFPKDGRVIRVNCNKTYKEMGFTAKHPRGAYAMKENEPPVPTKLLNVEWQLGRSGVVTPVAILEPVNIDGAMVSRATLHNWGIMQSLEGLEIGCTVGVIRAGSIIPEIVEVY